MEDLWFLVIGHCFMLVSVTVGGGLLQVPSERTNSVLLFTEEE